jgi:transposase
MSRLRGGLTSKIHALVDGNSLPLRLALIAGEAHDNWLAAKLLLHLKSGAMLLAARIRCRLDQGSCRPIWRLGEHPTATVPKDALCFRPHLYRARNLIERFVNRIKQSR